MFNIKNEMLYNFLKIFIVTLFVIFVAVQADKKFVLDEIDFPIVSNTTSQTLDPVYYRGEASPEQKGTYHPTLYINSLALFIRTFGFSETSVRFFGVVCTLFAATLLILILRLLIKRSDALESLFLGLFLLNPYTLANTTLPDIDSTVLPITILLFVYFSLKYLLQKGEMGSKVFLILAALFALALWSKLTTPLILPLFLFFLASITTDSYRKSFVFTFKVMLAGLLLFTLTYLAYSAILGLPVTYTYSFLLDSFTKGTSSEGPLIGAISNLQYVNHFIYWLTIPLTVVLGISIIGTLMDKRSDEKSKIKKLLVIMAILVTFFYIALIAPFGGFFKYPFPVFGILLLSVIFFYEDYLRKLKIHPILLVVTMLIGYILEKKFWGDSMFLDGKPFKYIPLILLVFATFYLFARLDRNKVVTGYILVFTLFFSIGFQISISRLQAVSTYPTKYLYGQVGLEETVNYLQVHTDSKETIWSMKDVGYYTNNKYVESYFYYFDKSLESELINMLENSNVDYYVATTGIGQDNIDYYTDIRQILEKYAVKQEQFGNYVVYKAKE